MYSKLGDNIVGYIVSIYGIERAVPGSPGTPVFFLQVQFSIAKTTYHVSNIESALVLFFVCRYRIVFCFDIQHYL